MLELKNIRTIFFDYDGTLHNSIKIYAPAFRKAYAYLVNEGKAEERQWTDAEISYWLGFNPEEMWKNFMPQLDAELRNKCSAIISEEMKSLVEEGKPEFYEGALETLAFLKAQGYSLVLISNCKSYYKQCHSELFQLERYFEEFACSEEYDFIPKYDILKRIKSKYPEKMVIIGDRKQDIEAGKLNGIYTIGCRYGFPLEGELDAADMLIDDIRELKDLFLPLKHK